MLADSSDISVQSGTLKRDVHPPATFRTELLGFIADQLPRWRDRRERKAETSETVLTSQLCAHLNGAARHSPGWDSLQFRVEEADEQNKGRKIDLVAAPCGAVIWIEGRCHTDFDSLLPIECKRLPTPKEKDRDEREYVISKHSSTGGIQRFKAGHHGAGHVLGAMIAYVQDGAMTVWQERIAGWIDALAKVAEPGWSAGDQLRLERDDDATGLCVLCSSHARGKLPAIELRHLWLKMK